MLIGLTGASGFLGRYIANRLLRAGHRLRCWKRPQSDLGGFEPGELEWFDGQLGQPDASARLVSGADAVVHAALHWTGASRRQSAADLLGFLQTNLMGTLALMAAARDAGVGRFIFISTCAVHELILDDRPLDEAHPLWPTSHYGAHKAAIEAFVHSMGLGDGWTVCSLRPTGIYGAARPLSRSKWFDLVQRVARGEAVDSARGGKEVHAADVARAVELLLHAPEAAVRGKAFNCCDSYISEEHVARIAAELCASGSPISDRNRGPKHQIETGRLAELGMSFGGDRLLRATIHQLLSPVPPADAGDA